MCQTPHINVYHRPMRPSILLTNTELLVVTKAQEEKGLPRTAGLKEVRGSVVWQRAWLWSTRRLNGDGDKRVVHLQAWGSSLSAITWKRPWAWVGKKTFKMVSNKLMQISKGKLKSSAENENHLPWGIKNSRCPLKESMYKVPLFLI